MFDGGLEIDDAGSDDTYDLGGYDDNLDPFGQESNSESEDTWSPPKGKYAGHGVSG